MCRLIRRHEPLNRDNSLLLTILGLLPGHKSDSSTKGWAIVTGASSGMGLVFARELAQRGHNVLAVARRRDRLETLARNESARGGRIVPFAADLVTSEGLGSLVARIRDLGAVELLVNN